MASGVVDSEYPDRSNDTELLFERNDSLNDDLLLDDHVSNQRSRQRRITYENAIQHAGFGRFQYKLLVLCGWTLVSNAVEVLNVSYVLPLATCEMKLMGREQTWFIAIMFFGMLVGGLLVASLADWYGRKLVLILTLGITAVFGFAFSISQTSAQFMGFRFFCGIGVGSNIPVIFAYFVEFLPKSHRGVMLSFLSLFLVLGGILVSGLAWLMIPYTFGIDTDTFHFTSWHIFLSLCVIPSLLSALIIFLLPESPKFLMQCGRNDEAYSVFQSIFEVNHPYMQPSEFENRVNRLSWYIDHMNSLHDSTRLLPKSETVSMFVYTIGRVILKIFQSWMLMLNNVLRWRTLTMVAMFLFLSFGCYGFNVWFWDLFTDAWQQRNGVWPTVCKPFNDTQHMHGSELCNPTEEFFYDHLLVPVCCLPGSILTIFLINYIGRKVLIAAGMVLSALVISFAWCLNTLATLFLFSGLAVIGWSALCVLAVELYPTTLRCTAFGLLVGLGSLAAGCSIMLFSQLVHVTCVAPLILTAALLIGGSQLCWFLPNTRQTDLT